VLLKLCIVWTLIAPRDTWYCNIYLLLVYSFLPAMYIQPQANPPSFSKSYVSYVTCKYVYLSRNHVEIIVFLLKWTMH